MHFRVKKHLISSLAVSFITCALEGVGLADVSIPQNFFSSIDTYAGRSISANEVLEVEPPSGWINYCLKYTNQCRNQNTSYKEPIVTVYLYNLLYKTNIEVNNQITPLSDIKHWGISESWDLPYDGKGDCEDYAMMKKKLLIEAGIPDNSLVYTVVIMPSGERHTVLVVKTNQGDFILDNLNDEILPWRNSSYKLERQQSSQNQNIWLAAKSYQISYNIKESNYNHALFN